MRKTKHSIYRESNERNKEGRGEARLALTRSTAAWIT
jgi:hypothetical protein